MGWQPVAIICISLCITTIVLAYIRAEYYGPQQQRVVKRLEPPQPSLRRQDLEWLEEVTSDL